MISSFPLIQPLQRKQSLGPVKQLLNEWGVYETHPEFLKALDVVGLTWSHHLTEVVGGASGLVDLGGGSRR